MPNPPIIFGPPSGGPSSADCAQLLQDIARYQSYVDVLNRSLAMASGSARQPLLDALATATRVLEDTQANYSRHCVHAPLPPRPFKLDPWAPATPFGINVGNGHWHTGSVNAVCPISGNRLLIATEQGGLWMGELDAQGYKTTRCLSDSWIHYCFTCFALDPANPNRVFAGCTEGIGGAGGVYVGNTGVSYDDWFFVPLPCSLKGPLSVSSMIVLPGQRLLVVATGAGLCWTGIDSTPFTWYTDPAPVQRLANLEGDAFLLIASAPGPLASGTTLNTGQIGSAFTYDPVPAGSIQWVHHTNASNIVPVQIATCRDHPGNAYCLGTLDDATGSGLLYIIRLQPGSATWKECSYATNKPQELGPLIDIPHVTTPDGGTPKSDMPIAVHPTNPLAVAAAYTRGAMSHDGGATWIDLADMAGWHDDIHVLYFDEPTDSLYIPCDGGIVRRANATTKVSNIDNADTSWNRPLPVVMLYSPSSGPLGNLAVGGGIFAAGSQDNADLWCDPATPEWRLAGVGDGGVVAIHQRGPDTYLLHGQTMPKRVQWSQRAGDAMTASQLVLTRLAWVALDGTGLDPVCLRPVPPQIGMVTGPLSSPVIALAAPGGSNVVYGAIFENSFTSPFGVMQVTNPPIEWMALCQIPAGEAVSAVESYDAGSVLAGTASGRLFRVPLGGASSEVFFDQKPSAPIKGVASDGINIACFTRTAPGKGFASSGSLWVGQISTQPLALLNAALFPPNGGAAQFSAIAGNRNSKFLRLSFALVVNQNEVWVSNSPLGVFWHKWVEDLPVAIHGSDIVITESAASGEVWLSTYGRGLWRLPFA